MNNPKNLQDFVLEMLSYDARWRKQVAIKNWLIVAAIAWLVIACAIDQVLKLHQIGPIPNLPFAIVFGLLVWQMWKRYDAARNLDLDLSARSVELKDIRRLEKQNTPGGSNLYRAYKIESPGINGRTFIGNIMLNDKPLRRFVETMQRHGHHIELVI